MSVLSILLLLFLAPLTITASVVIAYKFLTVLVRRSK